MLLACILIWESYYKADELRDGGNLTESLLKVGYINSDRLQKMISRLIRLIIDTETRCTHEVLYALRKKKLLDPIKWI